jgi:hypothetical protein
MQLVSLSIAAVHLMSHYLVCSTNVSLCIHLLCVQVQDLQKRISELEQLRFESAAVPTREYDALSSRHPLQPPRVSSTGYSQQSCTIQPGATNAGDCNVTPDSSSKPIVPHDAGAWIVGPTRYPSLNGRPMRDAGVQAQLSTSVTDAVSVRQEHVQVQTEVCEKFDRSSSPVYSPPASKDGDEGAPLNFTVDCSMKRAKKLLT